MHACAHDCHTAMLFGAARYLAETRNFSGTAIVIFQPAEESGAGAKAMIKGGLMERFGMEQVYGMHNFPGLPAEAFALRQGPILAAADGLSITIEGRGGHSSNPHECINPVLVGSHLITGFQQVIASNLDSRQTAKLSLCVFQSGVSGSIIPHGQFIRQRVRQVVDRTAGQTRAKIDLSMADEYPVTLNHPTETDLATMVAGELAGQTNVVESPLTMWSEDFSDMLKARPGA